MGDLGQEPDIGDFGERLRGSRQTKEPGRGRMAASHAAGSVCETKVVVMPVRDRMLLQRLHRGAEQAA